MGGHLICEFYMVDLHPAGLFLVDFSGVYSCTNTPSLTSVPCHLVGWYLRVEQVVIKTAQTMD